MFTAKEIALYILGDLKKMKCQFFIQSLAICGLLISHVACSGPAVDGSLLSGSIHMPIRQGEVVTEPASGDNPDNVAEYVVRVLTKDSECTGSLISQRVVLTAAHCVKGVEKASEISIGLGLNIGKDTPPDEGESLIYQPTDFVVHENFNMSRTAGDSNPHDLALIDMGQDLPAKYRPLLLPKRLPLGKEFFVTVAGYGKIHGRYDDSDASPNILRKAQLYFFVKSQKQFLIPAAQFKSGICHGDSGGPAMYKTDGNYFVIGVVSNTEPYQSAQMQIDLRAAHYDYSLVLPKYPDFDSCVGHSYFVNVKAHLHWIKKNMNRFKATEVTKVP
jgi:hypothetical protein